MTVVGLLLAAGRGRRFDPDGRLSKLEALVDGRPVAVRALDSLAAGCDEVVAVCRADQVDLGERLRREGARLVVLGVPREEPRARRGARDAETGSPSGSTSGSTSGAPTDATSGATSDAAEGMGISLAAGARAIAALLPAPAAGRVLVLPGDMPWLAATTIAMIRTVETTAPIVVPVLAGPGTEGHPVRFDGRLLPALAALGGDRGARVLFERYPVHRVTVADDGIIRDVDRPADLAVGDALAPERRALEPPEQ